MAFVETDIPCELKKFSQVSAEKALGFFYNRANRGEARPVQIYLVTNGRISPTSDKIFNALQEKVSYISLYNDINDEKNHHNHYGVALIVREGAEKEWGMDQIHQLFSQKDTYPNMPSSLPKDYLFILQVEGTEAYFIKSYKWQEEAV